MNKNYLILIVDDEASMRFVMREALEQKGFDVVESENGLEALEIFEEQRPDLVLLDVYMPQMDGFEACRRLRKHQGGVAVPIVIITGSEDYEAISAAYDAGATDFISKPINWLILTERVRYMLRASAMANELQQSQDLLAKAQAAARLGSFEFRPEISNLKVSDEFLNICPLSDIQETISWDAFGQKLCGENYRKMKPFWQRALTRGVSIQHDLCLEEADSSERHVMLHVDAETDTDGQMHRLIGIVQDITQRKLSELLETDQKQVMHRIVKKESLEEICLEVARLLERQQPQSFFAVCQVKEERIRSMVSPSLPLTFCNSLTDTPLSSTNGTCSVAAFLGQSVVVEDIATNPFWKNLRDLALTHELRSSAAVPIFAGTGQVLGTISMFRKDIYHATNADLELMERMANLVTLALEQKYLSQRLIHQAQHDPLTGLVNRGTLDQWLSQTFKKYAHSPSLGAYMLIDLDRFKHINDSLGHHIGDLLLQEVADRFRHCVRESDVLCRIGGDEFVLILKKVCDKQDAVSAASRILESFKSPFIIEGHSLQIAVSIGITLFPEDAGDQILLHKNADIAMYTAKNRGGNQYRFFDTKMREEVVQRLQIENDLRKAIERNEFELHYQPQINLASNRLMVFEALIRWNHPKRGRIPPDRFIPVAEQSRLIIPIGRWVLREACHQNVLWQRQGFSPVRVAVNVSAVQFKETDFVKTVQEVLEETGLDPYWLEVEITETEILDDLERACLNLQKIKELGVTTTLDDFGTGYSSITYLREIPLDGIKVDRSFIRDMENGSPSDKNRNTSLVKAMAALAKNLDLNLVAEGIETKDQSIRLMSLGYAIGQGFLFSAPVPANDAAHLLGQEKNSRPECEILS